ncbi:bifunctional DNA primase/polymerase [Novispirillum itersonii]|uniref:bifunctional DNA primase/polymerase n=1 Tax=Novispirillum itersonii TaxID=189 RepID=UPI00036C9C9F|nr:bifunctional DNA primase/polymerase [Novispirillum itersonii]
MFDESQNPVPMTPPEWASHVPHWQFVPVRGKRPFMRDWQDWPHSWQDAAAYAAADGIGLLNGPVSGGVMSLDVDGPEALEFLVEIHPEFDLDGAVWWTSGKPDRFQAAFQVTFRHWDELKTYKAGPGGALEFRWHGSQSVLPPSRHPQTGAYLWGAAPSGPLPQLPDVLMTFWLDACKPVQQAHPVRSYAPSVSVTDPEYYRLVILLDLISRGGRLPYSDWLRVVWGAAHMVGPALAECALRATLGEEKGGEYHQILRGYKPGGITAGTVWWYACQVAGEQEVREALKM